MKKVISVILILVLLLSLGVTAFAATTVRSHQALTVNGKPANCDIYNINGNNYFKLRDLAYLVNGTGSQFAVGYDKSTNCVTITTGAAYTPAGSELVIGDDLSSTAVKSAQTIFIDGQLCDSLSVYNIGGNNYFKLRDLGSAVGFSVDYDKTTQTMIVETAGLAETTEQPDARQLLIGETVPISSDDTGTRGIYTPSIPDGDDDHSNSGGSGGYGYYIVNKNSGVFHRPTCPSVDRMKESNKLVSYKTKSELVAAGYSPCHNCNP